MDRRRKAGHVLLAALVLLAGCSAAGSIDLRAVDGQSLAAEASREFTEREERTPGEGPSPREIVQTVVENGSITVRGQSPPVAEGLPVEHGGAYYDLQWTVVDRETATLVDLAVDYNATDASGPAVDYGDLPAPDRAALDALLPPVSDRRTEGFDAGAGVTYTDAELNASVLVDGEYAVVVYEGERYPVEVRGTRSVTVRTFRYEASRVAANATAYAAQLRAEYAFALSNLSDRQRSVIETAAGEGSYYAESTDDEAFAAVVDLFLEHEAIHRDHGWGLWLVRYEGTLHVVELEYGQFVEDRTRVE